MRCLWAFDRNVRLADCKVFRCDVHGTELAGGGGLSRVVTSHDPGTGFGRENAGDLDVFGQR
jgi:hypothetical protein